MDIKGTYYFYDNSVKLLFDADKHVYYREIEGELHPVLGVTSIIHILEKPWLVPWAAKRVSEKMAKIMPVWCPEFETVPHTETMPLPEFLELLQQAKTAPRDILEDAGDVGTEAHNCLETSIWWAIHNTKGVVTKLIKPPTEERALNCCNAALSWMQRHNVRWHVTERKIYSLKHNYGGTMDGLCVVDRCDDPLCCPEKFEDRLSLADWKSSNQLSVDYLYQTAAYEAAYEEETNINIADRWILRLGKEDGKFEPWHLGPEDFEQDLATFLACLNLTRLNTEVSKRMAAAKKLRTFERRERKKKT